MVETFLYSLTKNHTKQRDKEQKKGLILDKEFLSLPQNIKQLYIKLQNFPVNQESILIDRNLLLQLFWLEYLCPTTFFLYQARAQSQRIAQFLSKNFLNPNALFQVKKDLENLKIGKDADSLDFWLSSYQEEVVDFLISSPDISHLLTKISLKDLDDLIVNTLLNTIAEIKRDLILEDVLESVLVSAFFPLRQTIGACFATSFVISLQRENLTLFFEELINLISRGHLKRVIEGKEFIVPFNASLEKPIEINPVISSLLRNQLELVKVEQIDDRLMMAPPLLKCFEYTIASMTEFNLDSHAGTLYVSLGVDPSVETGLGKQIYTLVEEELRRIEEEAHKAHIEAQKALDVVNMTNSQMSQATSYERVQSLQATGQSFQSQLQAALEKRDELVNQSEEISGFFSKWQEGLAHHIKFYFQEVFDPKLKKEEFSYEDSPAGFRLVCKHGRQIIKTWTMIDSPKEYFLSLKEFFLNFEHKLHDDFQTRRIKSLSTQITNSSIQFVLNDAFISEALNRLKAINTPYEYIEPWAYLSGGTLTSVLGCFIGKLGLLQQVTFHPKDATELLIQIIDFIKDSPARLQERFIKNGNRGLLAQSSTHAFILKPGFKELMHFWIDPYFSYTKIRDEFLTPLYDFYRNKKLRYQELSMIIAAFEKEFDLLVKIDSVKQIDIPSLAEVLIQQYKAPHQKVCGFIHKFLKENCEDFPKLSSIRFADTNWPYFNFSFIVNPVNIRLEIWRESFDFKESLPMVEWGDQFSGQHGWIVFLETLDKLHFSSIELLKISQKV